MNLVHLIQHIRHSLHGYSMGEKLFWLFAVMFWVWYTSFHFVQLVFFRPFLGEIGQYFVFPVIFALMLAVFGLKHLEVKIRVGDFVFLILWILGLVSSWFIHGNAEYFRHELDWYVWFLVFTTPFGYFVAAYVKFDRTLFDSLYLASLLGVFLAYFRLFVLKGGLEDRSEMSLAYFTLPSVLMLIHYAFLNISPKNWGVAFWGIAFLFMTGNRGSVLTCFVFIALVVIYHGVLQRRALFLVVSVILILGLLKLTLSSMEALMPTLEQMNVSTRIVDRFDEGILTISSGREETVYPIAKQLIRERPYQGHGMLGDRPYFGGNYPHNLFFEFWIQYGVALGSLLLIAYFGVFVHAFYVTKDYASRVFLLLLLSVVGVKLQLSSSYLLEGLFYFQLGACMNLIRLHRENMKRLVWAQHGF